MTSSSPCLERLVLDESLTLSECRQFQEKLSLLWESWREFQANGRLRHPKTIRPEVLASWERCKARGIDPYSPLDTVYAQEEELIRRRENSRILIEVASPVLQTLAKKLTGSGFRVDLLDPDLFFLAQFGEPSVIEESSKRYSVPGGNRGEKSCGTNAINLAALLLEPVQLVGPEHYNVSLHYWTCSAVPILSPQKELIGVINIAGHFSLLHGHTLGMAVAVGKAIEQSLQQRELLDALELSHEYLSNVFHSVSDGIITIDVNGIITTFNRAAGVFLGREPSKVVGLSVDKVFGMDNPFTKVLNTGERMVNREILLRVGGHTRVFVGTIEPLKIRQGLEGVVGVIKPLASVKGFVGTFAGLTAHITFEDLIGDSLEFRKAIQLAKQAAEFPTTVLLQGESGTGKDLFAQAIHNASPFNDGPFVAVNCPGIPGNLVESELFGYEGGAFTGAKKSGQPGKFELAESGTLFLDEIGSMPLNMQVKLLRSLQNKTIVRVGGRTEIPVNARLICATNSDLWQQVHEGSFREDLFYRINVLTIVIPPLRDRAGDIPRLVKYFCNKLNHKLGVNFKMDSKVYDILSNYDWPGNVRELENMIERSGVVALARGSEEITLEDALSYPGLRKVNVQATTRICSDISSHSLDEIEIATIREALRSTGGNVSQAANLLGIHRSTLYRKLRRYREL